MEKRYNLVMPDDMARRVEQIARTEKITLVDFLRRCIKIGIIVYELSKTDDSAVLLKRGSITERIYFL